MLRAVDQIQRMRGGAQSHLMRCSDGLYYVVKFQNNPQHRRVLVNELLGTRLASRLGIDYGYHRNGTRGFVQTLSVTRAPGEVNRSPAPWNAFATK